MSVTEEPAVVAAPAATRPSAALRPAAGLALLGEVHGSGYRDGAALVRRADGQMVQLGPLMYALLDSLDGQRDLEQLAAAMSERLGRGVEAAHVVKIADKLAAQGLLAGSEDNAPPRSNPLLALRFKVLVTNPVWTRRLTAPFTVLFRPWVVWPMLAAFAAVCWFVLVHKGVAAATAEAFDKPELLLLVFGLAVGSAGFHELGHASACRYGGGTPGGMGMGLYMVWPAFYTDVTDAYRLPRRDRLRVDLGGLYFNAVVAVATLGVWLAVRVDALLLLIGLQLLQMVKQLSPMIRADGYHILADLTGVPDLFAHIGPTLRRVLPGRREPSALTGRARVLVTLWVLVVVPVLLSLTITGLILFPRLVATAYESGRVLVSAIGHDAADGRVLDVLASCLRLVALALPVFGVALMGQRVLRGAHRRARSWSDGHPGRRALVVVGAVLALAATALALWPAGQYRAIAASDRGTLGGLVAAARAPQAFVRPGAAAPQRVHLAPGRHIAVSLIPVGGASERHPAFFVIKGREGEPAAVIVSRSAPDPTQASSTATPAGAPAPAPSPSPSAGTSTAPAGAPAPKAVTATAFPFKLPDKPRPGENQALAVNTKDGSVKYVVAYSLVTVRDGAPVTNANTAYAFASCRACTTVSVAFQVVLVVGTSRIITPINVAGALNANCPACITTAIADQIVVTLKSEPSDDVLRRLQDDLKQLDGLDGRSPADVAGEVAEVQRAIDQELDASGLRANDRTSTNTTTTSGGATQTPTTTSTTPTSTSTTPTSTTPTSTTPTSTTPTQTTTTPTSTTTTTTETTPSQTTTTETTTTTTSTTTTPSGSSTDSTGSGSP